MFASSQLMSAPAVPKQSKTVITGNHDALELKAAIHETIGRGDHDALEMIIAEHGAAVLDQRKLNGNAPLHTAVACMKADCLKTLVKANAPLNSVNAQGMTPLHLAIQLEQTGAALTLIAAGADCSLIDEDGHTPLHRAMSHELSQSIVSPTNIDPEPRDDSSIKLAIDGLWNSPDKDTVIS